MRKLWDRIKRQFGYYPGAYPMGRGTAKPRHAPIPLPELRQRITDQVEAALKPRGFERPSRKFETWVRRRTPYIYDLAGANFVKSEPSIGMVEVSLISAVHLPVVEKIYHRFAGGIYRVQSETAGKMLHIVYRKEKLPISWYFWATAYSEKATQMIVDQIVDYGLPLLEQVTDYESLLAHPFLSDIYSARKAILLALVGRADEAQRLLESAIEEDERIRAGRKRTEPLETSPGRKALDGILDALRTGRFNEFVEKATAEGLAR